MADWPPDCHTGVADAVARFKAALPGWWYSLGECDVSCDASCAPTRAAPEHLALIPLDARFDHGFHADLAQPSTLSAALGVVMAEVLKAIDAARSG